MYNLHCHSLLSDGALLPSEVAVRYMALGWRAIAITDHADYSNIATLVKATLEFTRHWPRQAKIKVLAGIELSHLPLEQFQPLARYAKREGIKIIIAHGETLIEPVIKGTNQAALEAGIDILAHPGLISASEVKLAKKKNVFLEITARPGHRDTNRHIIEAAKRFGAKLILNIDSHEPEDIIGPNQLMDIARKNGLTPKDINKIFQDVSKFLSKKEER